MQGVNTFHVFDPYIPYTMILFQVSLPGHAMCNCNELAGIVGF